MSILSAISAALSLLNHLFQAYNNSKSVQAKVAQMSQNDRDRHSELIDQAINAPSLEDRQKAVDEIRKLVGE